MTRPRPETICGILAAAVLLLAIFAFWQAQRITALEEQLATLAHTNARLTNLEYIINAHTAQIKEVRNDIYHLEEAQADLDWRTRENAWDIQGR